ncbi:MAG: hypothetical protein C4293_05455 [Nitrospiraceae bacterium]
MNSKPCQKARAYKLRGTIIAVDLLNHTILIQPSEHQGKRLRQLTVGPESEIFAGDEYGTMADLIVGDWVNIQFANQGEQSVIRKLHVPRSMMSGSRRRRVRTSTDKTDVRSRECPSCGLGSQEPSAGK